MPAGTSPKRKSGRYVTVSTVGKEAVRAFLPEPPPRAGLLGIDASLRDTLDRALLALGRLDSVSLLLPNTAIFLYGYVRKEAVLSSQIEGTQSSLSDLLLFEADEVRGALLDDVREVANYVAALEHGLKLLRKNTPLSNRLIRELHRVLLRKGRGSAKSPGQFRRSQNRVGGSRPGDAVYVPPPPERVADCMAELERFLNDVPERTSPLLKAGIAHAQFETIHPFLDGNGRVGRLLITLVLCNDGVLREPMLYPSLYLKQHRDEYYLRLQAIRTEGDWEGWIDFFSHGVIETAEAAVAMARSLASLFEEDSRKLRAAGRAAGSAIRIHQALQRQPIMSVPHAVELTGLSAPTARAALTLMADPSLGITKEITGKRRDRIFAYERYVRLLNEGTDLPFAGVE